MVNGPYGINGVRRFLPNGKFRHLGELLAAPALSIQSPYLAWDESVSYQSGIDDMAYERIPQQILSLVKADEPRVTVYAYGQALEACGKVLAVRAESSPAVQYLHQLSGGRGISFPQGGWLQWCHDQLTGNRGK